MSKLFAQKMETSQRAGAGGAKQMLASKSSPEGILRGQKLTLETLKSGTLGKEDIRLALDYVKKNPSSKKSLNILNALSENHSAISEFENPSTGLRAEARRMQEIIREAGLSSEASAALDSIVRRSFGSYGSC